MMTSQTLGIYLQSASLMNSTMIDRGKNGEEGSAKLNISRTKGLF